MPRKPPPQRPFGTAVHNKKQKAAAPQRRIAGRFERFEAVLEFPNSDRAEAPAAALELEVPPDGPAIREVIVVGKHIELVDLTADEGAATSAGSASVAWSDSDPRTPPVADPFDSLRWITLVRPDLRKLDPRACLNDEIINAYAKLVEASFDGSNRPFVFHTKFYSFLMDPNEGFAHVRKWTARRSGTTDLFASSAVFFPLHVGNNHWTLAVADMAQRKITYYDSLGDSGEDYLKNLLTYLRAEHQARHNTPLVETWVLHSPRTSSPQQKNGYDCGVFCLALLNVLHGHYAFGDPLDFASITQENMPKIRAQIRSDLERAIEDLALSSSTSQKP